MDNATSCSLCTRPRDPDWYFYPGLDAAHADGQRLRLHDSAAGRQGPLHDNVRVPEGIVSVPPTGHRALDARACFCCGVMANSPMECMRLSGIGSQYLLTTVDADGLYFDGGTTDRVMLPIRPAAEG